MDKGEKLLAKLINRKYSPETHPEYFKEEGTPDVSEFLKQKGQKSAAIEKTALKGNNMEYFWDGFEKQAVLKSLPTLNNSLSKGMSLSAMKPVIKQPKISTKKDLLLPTPIRKS